MRAEIDEKPVRRRGLSREDVLEGAAVAFARGGYHGTTMREVAAELDVTAGALYSHFSGKDELFGALHQQVCDRFLGAIDAPMPEDLPLEHAVELLLLRVLELVDRHHDELAMFIDAPQQGEAGHSLRGFYLLRERLERWLARDHRDCQLRCPPKLAAMLFAGILIGVLRDRLIDASPPPVSDHAAAVRAAFLCGVAGESHG